MLVIRGIRETFFLFHRLDREVDACPCDGQRNSLKEGVCEKLDYGLGMRSAEIRLGFPNKT